MAKMGFAGWSYCIRRSDCFGCGVVCLSCRCQVEEYIKHLDVEDKGGLNHEQFITLVTEKVVCQFTGLLSGAEAYCVSGPAKCT